MPFHAYCLRIYLFIKKSKSFQTNLTTLTSNPALLRCGAGLFVLFQFCLVLFLLCLIHDGTCYISWKIHGPFQNPIQNSQISIRLIKIPFCLLSIERGKISKKQRETYIIPSVYQKYRPFRHDEKQLEIRNPCLYRINRIWILINLEVLKRKQWHSFGKSDKESRLPLPDDPTKPGVWKRLVCIWASAKYRKKGCSLCLVLMNSLASSTKSEVNPLWENGCCTMVVLLYTAQ